MFEFTTKNFTKTIKDFQNLKRIQKKFEKTQTKKSILFKHEQNETNRQQVDQLNATKNSSLNIDEIEIKTNKIKILTKLNLRNVYHSIRFTTKKANKVTIYQNYENSTTQKEDILMKITQLIKKRLKQRLLNY